MHISHDGAWSEWVSPQSWPRVMSLETLGATTLNPEQWRVGLVLLASRHGCGSVRIPPKVCGYWVRLALLMSLHFTHACLPQWIERVVGWLGKVFLQDNPSRPCSPEAGNTLRRWRCHVQRFFYRIYASLRIEELFSIIRGWSCLLPCSDCLCFSFSCWQDGELNRARPPDMAQNLEQYF